ncbi:DUF2975 domain-containing protein [Flavobacterium lacus]|uniref:DUF2975 family protein n=1 Tax=Flavobacterium lacus TaxID=1353778 RepID=A0A328WML3_9FLAO|nr:DUF2975 domain-containing protein [Flavobacterium lacus]RAR46505.1 Protein of unknown function (DUF2975) [Flavobacterium lacus]
MSKRNNIIFKGLHVIAYIIFVGLCIEAGAVLVNLVFSLIKPEVIANLYQKLDLMDMYVQSQPTFFGMFGFILSIAVLKAYLFYEVIVLLHKLDLEKPFNAFVSAQITKISYTTLSIGLLSYVAKQIAEKLVDDGFNMDALQDFWLDSQAFILMAAVIYVIATLFARGVAMQAENELTI